MQYMKNFRQIIGKIISKRDGKSNTLEQFWFVDTSHPNALGVIFPPNIKVSWLERKLSSHNWVIIETNKLNCAGKDKSLSFINIVVRYNDN